ncbi:MAG: hypothetical protein KIT10_13400 [Flavobacteriales bacterium]|nr:hypothetical protein [Flavobacteriales bacterium]
MQIGSTGNVTVGTGLAVPGTRMSIGQASGSNWLELRRTAGAGSNSSWLLHDPENDGALEFRFQPAEGDPLEKVLSLHDNGKVSIGDVPTDTPFHDYRLYVQGGLLTEKVKVALKTSDEWSDHVFKPGYRLMPLPEVKAFIKEHGHLPGVPSAEQMVEQGLDVVRTNAMLMEKVEELMLYVLQLEERIDQMERARTFQGGNK